MVEAIGALDGRIPVLTCFMSARGLPAALSAPGCADPVVRVSRAGGDRARARRGRMAAWRRAPGGRRPDVPGLRQDEAAAVIAEALERGESGCEPDEIARLFDCYGIPVARQARAETPEAAADAAAGCSRPGRAQGDRAAAQDRRRRGSARAAARPRSRPRPPRWRSGARAGEPFDGFLVQELVEGGVEMLVGSARRPGVRADRRRAAPAASTSS